MKLWPCECNFKQRNLVLLIKILVLIQYFKLSCVSSVNIQKIKNLALKLIILMIFKADLLYCCEKKHLSQSYFFTFSVSFGLATKILFFVAMPRETRQVHSCPRLWCFHNETSTTWILLQTRKFSFTDPNPGSHTKSQIEFYLFRE
jgi:hypothetical protein